MKLAPHRTAPPRRLARRLVLLPALASLALPAAALALSFQTPPAEPMPGRVVYTRADEGLFNIFTADADGTNEALLSDIEESSAGEYQPRFSPDGQRVVFATTDRVQGLASYWLIPFSGGTPEAVVTQDGRGLDPSWSPDSTCFVYSGAHGPVGGADHDRFDIKRWCEGEGVTVLTNTPDVDERDPSYSPDGSTIVFSARPAVEDPTPWRIERMAADGSDRSMVLDRANQDRRPLYAPDGETIAFIASDFPNFEIGTLSILAPTGGVTPLVRKPAGPFAWSPEGGHLLFGNIDDAGVTIVGDGAEQDTPQKGIYRIEVATRALERLKGAAGGSEAKENAFDFGYGPDWTAGTYTPTPDVTETPTPRPSATATATTDATATPEATATASPTETTEHLIYLPRLDNGEEEEEGSGGS